MPQPDNQADIRALLPFCQTDAQRADLQAILTHGGRNAAARETGRDRKTITRTVVNVQNLKALHDSTDHLGTTTPLAFPIKGTSSLRKVTFDDGSEGLQWVKTDRQSEIMEQLWAEAVNAMGESIPRAKPTKAPKETTADLLNCYVITDYHLGMYSWPDETGDKWDTDIAEQLLVDWFGAAIHQSPPAHTAVLAQLGDFLHWDGLAAITPTNKHLLDADTRFAHVVRTAIRVLRRVIAMLLETHQAVHVICAEGNHDPASSIWLREWFAALYEDEPRLTVDQSPNPYYAVEWGDTSLYFHHGHLKGVKNVDQVFAAQFRELFGRTKHSFAHMGHYHHQVMLETNLMVVEQHRTLSAKDAYAARGGYEAGRDASVITYHKQHGRAGRVYLSAAMVSPT